MQTEEEFLLHARMAGEVAHQLEVVAGIASDVL
jgi:hypothetical protein